MSDQLAEIPFLFPGKLTGSSQLRLQDAICGCTGKFRSIKLYCCLLKPKFLFYHLPDLFSFLGDISFLLFFSSLRPCTFPSCLTLYTCAYALSLESMCVCLRSFHNCFFSSLINLLITFSFSRFVFFSLSLSLHFSMPVYNPIELLQSVCHHYHFAVNNTFIYVSSLSPN